MRNLAQTHWVTDRGFGRRPCRTVASLIFVALLTFLDGCGGGVGSSAPPPPPSFSIRLSTTTLAIAPNTSSLVSLSLVPANGFSGAVTVTLGGLPTGITALPASPFELPASGLTLTLTAGANVANGSYTLTFQATSGSLTSSATASLTVQPLASFSLSLFFSSLTVRQGGSVSGTFNITPTDSGSGNFSVSLSVSGLPTGVTASFAQNPQPIGIGQPSVTLMANSAATLVQNITVNLVGTRTSDGATATTPFFLNVAQPAGSLSGNRTTFVSTDDTPSSIAYDPVHNQIFAALPDLAHVDVISTTGQIIRSIPVPDARGLSLTPDGTRVLVTGYTQQLAWIDTSSLEIVQRDILPLFQPSCQCNPQFIVPGKALVMANGKVLVFGVTFVTGVLEWDPHAGQITLQNASSLVGQGVFGVRSGDGTKALFSSDSIPGTIALYDSASDSFTATRSFSNFPFALATNPHGTQFAVAVSGEPIHILNNQLQDLGNGLGQAPVGGILTGMQYSADGQYLYFVSTPGNVPLISTVNATSLTLIGQAPAYASNIAYITRVPPLFVETPMAADSSGMLFGAADHGVALDDSTDFQTTGAAGAPVFAIIVEPAEGPSTAPTSIAIKTQVFDTLPDVWFGSLRGTNLGFNAIGQVQATAPPSPVAGPVNVKIIDPDGTEGNIPQGYTYGSAPVSYSTLAVSLSGGVSADLFGYGFSADVPGAPIQVTVGGGAATVSLATLFPAEYPFGYPFPLQHLRVAIPAGTPGTKDVNVTSPAGSALFAKGLHYVQSVTSYSSADTFGLVIVDPTRQQLYLAAGDHLDVFSTSTRTFLSPIAIPSIGGTRQLAGLALTPDNAKLLVANFSDNSVAIINPDSPSSSQVVQVVPSGTGNGSVGPTYIASTSTGLCFIGTANGNPESGTTLNLYQLNLSTLQVSPVTISGNNLFVGSPATLAGARNGTAVFAFFTGNSGGTVYAWSASSGVWTNEHDTQAFLSDGGASGDGNVFAIDMAGGFGFTGTVVEFLDQQTNLLGRSGLPEFMAALPVRGMKLNDAGSLAYVPVTASIPTEGANSSESAVDIYDVAHNELRERVLLAETFSQPPSSTILWNGITIDPSGSNIFLLTNKGVTVVTLDAVPLSIGSVSPRQGSAGAPVTIRGSGFAQAITASFGATSGNVLFVDSDTLQATIPPTLPTGPVSITLTNPDGSTYKLDDAFTVN